MLPRSISQPNRSFFLLGPRLCGKTTWLKTTFPDAYFINLLKSDIYFRFDRAPQELREEVLALHPKTLIIIDEIQRVPQLLNEVHYLIEEKGYRFGLTGSSARKLKGEGSNLLAGRASILNMFPLIYSEYKDAVNFDAVLRFGSLPMVITEPKNRIEILEAYSGTYLREEIKAEALVRDSGAFSRFLEIAAIMNGQVTNLSSLARDSGTARTTVSSYFEILNDTLIGSTLPAWTPSIRVKEVSHPKFYFFDPGVVRALQDRLRDRPTEQEKGVLLETYILHELRAAISYQSTGGRLSFWRTNDGVEVDFIWQMGKKLVAIEVKSSKRWKPEFDKGFRALRESNYRSVRAVGVYLGERRLKTDLREVYPVSEFLSELSQGKILD